MKNKFSIYNSTLKNNSMAANVNALLADSHDAVSLPELLRNFKNYLSCNNVAGIAVCLYEQPLLLSSPEEFPMPEEVILSYYADLTEDRIEMNCDCHFDPIINVLPDGYFDDSDDADGKFVLSPISYDNKHFGYFICKIMDDSDFSNSVMMDLFSTKLAHSILNNSKMAVGIDARSNKDSLTNIFNRQGFIDAGQDTINLALKMSMSGIVAFADMDNLRQINDTYGHDMGDKAIQTLAEVFQIVFRKNDVFGRMGEDEFAAVLPGLDPMNFPMLQTKIDEMCAKVSEMKRLPFVVSMSMGAVEFDDDNYNLEELLKIADDRQFLEKKQKKE